MENIDRLFAAALARFGRGPAAPEGKKKGGCLPFQAVVAPTSRSCCAAHGGPDTDGDGRCDYDFE